ncbi:MAG: TGS domain-containing protein [Actinobacteria bacterium]|nr:TGS domain-containing protein [Actinomycetota bacterium]
MPANLTPEYKKAEKEYRAASTPQEKLAGLEKMLATIPKHKGTDHMQGDLKRRISKLKNASQGSAGARHLDVFRVEHSGIGQVVLLGTPNVGKSAVVASTTKARVQVADYPFTTAMPAPGMMPFEDVKIQLVDLPPVTAEHIPPGMMGAIRSADIVAVVVSLADEDPLTQVQIPLELLKARGVSLVRDRQVPEIPEPEDPDDRPLFPIRGFILATHMNAPTAGENLEAITGLYADQLEVFAVSCTTGENLDQLGAYLFEFLNVVRVYSKVPGKKVDKKDPFVLPRGSTVMDMAQAVHRDLPDQLRYARIWGANTYDGQTVHRNHVLSDGDVLELHT